MTLSVRGSLIGVSVLATVFILWLATSFWYDAYLQRSDATRILQITTSDDLLISVAQLWAEERLLVHTALSSEQPASKQTLVRILDLQRKSTVLINQAIANLQRSFADERLVARLAHGLEYQGEVARVTGKVENIAVLRRAVTNQLSVPRVDREDGVLDVWSATITDLIMSSHRLRVSSRYQAHKAFHNIEALSAMKNAVWIMSEYAAREQAIIAGTIAADDPLILDDVENLSAYRGHLEEAWFVVEAYAAERATANRIVAAVERLRADYFDRYENIRAPIIEAGMEGAQYPMGVEEWIDESTHAIAPILNLGTLAGEVSRELTSETEAQGVRRLVIDSAVLVLILTLAGLSVWAVLTRIVKPLESVTRAMTAIAGGDQQVEVPSTRRADEIGAMLRAIQVFKESAERHTGEISAANEELQQLNEGLEERVEQRTAELEAALAAAEAASDAKACFSPI